MMTRIELNNLLVQLVEAKARLAIAQQHYANLYEKLWNEVQQHYPIEPKE